MTQAAPSKGSMAAGGSGWLAKMRSSLTKQSISGIHVFELAFEHIEDSLNIAFRHDWYLHTRTLWQSHVCVVAYSGQFMFWGDFTKLPPILLKALTDFNEIRWFVCSRLLKCWCRMLWKSAFVWRGYKNGFREFTFSWTQCMLDSWQRWSLQVMSLPAGEPGSCMQVNGSSVSQSIDCSFCESALILTQSNSGSLAIHELA